MAAPTFLVDEQNPWPGLSSFTENAQDYFFGRENEIREILSRIEARPFTLLFGQSGLGKTSLLQAGLMPRLRKKNYLPIYTRLDYDSAAPGFDEQITRALLRALAEIGAPVPAHAPRSAPGESLWEWLHRTDARLSDAAGRTLTPILILDQFEEIFTLGERDAQARSRSSDWFRSLAYLVENWCPAEVKTRMQEQEALLEELDLASQPIRILLSMREDFLPHLDEREGEMPSMLLNRLRLTPLRGTEALEAVLKPAPRLVARPVAEAIVRFVSGELKAELSAIVIATPILNLVCRELNERRKARKLAVITPDLIEGDAGKILRQFYEECVEGQPPALRIFIEEELLSTSGHRENISEERADRIMARDRLPKSALEDLVTRRLLQKEERLGRYRFELIHDVLCGPIAQSRTERADREREEREEAERKAVLAKMRQIRRRLFLAGVGMLVGIVLLAYASWAGYQARQRSAQLARMISLMNDNHRWLVQLGVANPKFKPLEIDLFERNLNDVDELIKEGGPNLDVLWMKFRMLVYLSDLLTDPKDAAIRLERAQEAVPVAASLAKLEHDDEEGIDIAEDLGDDLSAAFFQLHHTDEAQKAYDAATRMLDQLPPKYAGEVHKAKARMISSLYFNRLTFLKPEEKDAMLKQSMTEAQKGYDENPDDIDYASNLAWALIYRASYLNDYHPGKAELSSILDQLSLLEKKINPMTDKLDRAVDVVRYRDAMASVYQTKGEIERENSKWDRAEDSFNNYVQARAHEIANDPNSMGKDYNLETQENSLATANNDRGDFERALVRETARDVNKRETALNIAQDSYDAALEIGKKLVQEYPTEPDYWSTLGNTYDGLKNLAIDRANIALNAQPSDLPSAGQYYQQAQNQIDEHINALKQASQMAERDDKFQRARSVAIALREEGVFESDRAKAASEDTKACRAGALSSYNASLSLLDELLKSHPGDTDMELSAALTHSNLRSLLQAEAETAVKAGHDAEAKIDYAAAENQADAYLKGIQQLTLQQHAAKADDLGNQSDLVDALVVQGDLFRSEANNLKPPPANEFARANKCYADALVQNEMLIKDNPTAGSVWTSEGQIHESMAGSAGDEAIVMLARGDKAGAKALFEKANDQVALDVQANRQALAVAVGEDRPDALHDLASALGEASFDFLFVGKYAEAEQDATAAIFDDPSKLWVTTNQAHALLLSGQFDDAWRIYQQLAFERLYSDDKETFAEAVEADFDTFEKARDFFTPQQLADMEKVRRQLRQLTPPTPPANSN